MSNHPLTMFRYHTWANQTILGRIQELPSDVLSQEVNSSFPTIAHALSHLHAIDTVWYRVLAGMEMPEAYQTYYAPLNARILPTVEEYIGAYAELSEQFGEWFRGQDDLEQAIMLDNPFAGPRLTCLSEIVLQMVNHGTYHRGNVSTMLRQLGHASVMHDYALFWYLDSAAASASAVPQ